MMFKYSYSSFQSSFLLLSQQHLLLLLLITSNLITNLNARDVEGEVQINKDSCWDKGYVDYVSSPGVCQLHCSFISGCNSWAYGHNWLGRCHLCSMTTPRTTVSCDVGTTCKTWGVKSNNLNAVSLLNDGLSSAQKVCRGKLSSDDSLIAAEDLNLIINKYRKGDFDSDTTFMTNLPLAGDKAALILSREGLNCKNNITGPSHSCKYGSLVFHQLRALLLYIDNGNPDRAFPKKRDKVRKIIFKRHKVLIADNGWMSNYSLWKLNKFYTQLPTHMSQEGILYDALFATQTVKDAWKCNGNSPGNLSTSNRGYNVFQTQVGQSYEQAFPGDTPSKPQAFDLQLTVTRHEVAHQFDRIIVNRKNDNGDGRLYDLKLMLTEASKGYDLSWLRSQVGDTYFQGAPQEIIASQIGNQYLGSSSSQLRLAASRLKNDWTPIKYPTINQEGIATLTRGNKECSKQSKNLGEFDTAQKCVDAAMSDASCSYEIMFSSDVPSWGCRCCQPFDEMTCPTEESLYTSHDLWDVYQYKNTSNEPTCNDGTGLPLSWFLFNVDLLTPVNSAVATLYENESNGEVITVQAKITRESDSSNGRINSMVIPFCDGEVTFGYDSNGIVNSVSPNAATCTFKCQDDKNWVTLLHNGKEKGCSWIGNRPKRCNYKVGIDGRKASEVCLATCNKCSIN